MFKSSSGSDATYISCNIYMMIAVGGEGIGCTPYICTYIPVTYLCMGGIPAAKCNEFHSEIWKRALHTE